MAIVIPYVKQTWTDGVSQASAARLGVLEEGILDVSQSPAVRVFHNANQNITSGVTLTAAFNSERFDQAGGVASTMHDTVTNNSRLTAIYAGVYQITAVTTISANATGNRVSQIRLNGTTVIAETREVASSASDNITRCTNCLYSMAVNDYVEVLIAQNSGSTLTLNSTGNSSPEFMMVRVG